jgi:hypothetical protein
MGGLGTKADFDLYCQTVEIFIEDLKNAKDPNTAETVRFLLKRTTAYSAYGYDSWQQAWPSLKAKFESREKWANQARTTSNAVSSLHADMTLSDADEALGHFGGVREFAVSSAIRRQYRYVFIPNADEVTLRFDERDKLLNWQSNFSETFKVEE